MNDKRKTKIIHNFNNCKYVSVVEVTDIVKKLFGVSIKLAYLIIDCSDRKDSLLQKSVILRDSVLSEDLYVEFDNNHKVLFRTSEWIYISEVK